MIKDISHIRRLPRLGCIRLGIKVESKKGKTYPKEVDYFILDPDTSSDEDDKRLINEFRNLYGDKPKAIKIMFPVPDPEKYFPQNYKRYGSSTSLKCIGDGETAECVKDEFSKGLKVLGKSETGLTRVECKGKSCIYAKKECMPVGVLRVLLPELQGAGVWQITTGSFNSIVNLNSCIDYITALCGRAHMIPLILERRPQTTAYEGQKATHYTLHVNVGFKLVDIQKIAQSAPSEISLALPDVDTPDTAGDRCETAGLVEAAAPAEDGPSATNKELVALADRAKGLGLNKGAYVKFLKDAGFTTLKGLTTRGYNEINKRFDEYENAQNTTKESEQDSEPTEDQNAIHEELMALSEGEDLSVPIEDQEAKNQKDKEVGFDEFMRRARAEIIDLTGDSKLYNSELETFSVRFLPELKGNAKKQANIRSHFEALLAETRELNSVPG